VIVRAPAPRWILLHDKDWTLESTAAGASAPGALTLAGLAGTVVNAGSAFLAASSGISVEATKGLRVDTTGCTTGPNDNLFAATGAGWVVPLTTLLGSTLWPNTQPGPEVLWSELCLMAVCDFSGVATNGEGMMIGITNNSTTFALGTGGGVARVSGVNKPIQSGHNSAFASSSSTIAEIGGCPSLPDCVAVTTTPQGGGTYWGVSPGGVAYPTSWYGRDQHVAAMGANNPITAGGYIRNTGGIFMSVWDTGKTTFIGWVKRWTLWGRNPSYRFPNAGASAFSVGA
jgi:hypothetical protein